MAKYKLLDKIVIFSTAILAIYTLRIVFSNNEGFLGGFGGAGGHGGIPSAGGHSSSNSGSSTRSGPAHPLPTWAIILMSVLGGIFVLGGIIAIIVFVINSNSSSSIP